MRSIASILSIVLVLLPSTTAFAADKESKAACVGAYEGAQLAMKRGELKRAHGELAACLSDACPQALRSDCATWLKEVETREPSVVFSYIDALGKSKRDVRVLLNGALVSAELDGRGYALDPGMVVVTFEPQGGNAHDLRFVVREGQKLQLIEYREPLKVPPPGPTTVAPRAEPSRVPLYIGLGVLGVGLAGFGGFGAWGLSGKSSLESCKPFCTDDEASGVRSRFIVADVSLAVATVGAVITVVSLFTLANHPNRTVASSAFSRFPGAF